VRSTEVVGRLTPPALCRCKCWLVVEVKQIGQLITIKPTRRSLFPWLSCLIMQIVPDVGPSLPAVVSVVELSSGVFEKRLSANT